MSVIEFFLYLLYYILTGRIFALIFEMIYALTPLIILFTAPLFFVLGIAILVRIVEGIRKLRRKLKG